jgi:SAM-dependent methyltransferase
MSTPGQVDVNMELWETGDFVDEYANRTLTPAEVVILVRYREALSGRVLEVGCGGGRILGYFVALAGEAHGMDVSPSMVEYCRRTYPEAHVRVGDLRDFANPNGERYDAIFAGGNVIDVLDDSERRRVLAGMRDNIAPGGLLVFNSHNLAQLDAPERHDRGDSRGASARALLLKALNRPPARVVRAAASLPRKARNRRRLGPLQRRAEHYAIVNDEVFDYGLLHYYIRRDDQARQLSELGYELIEVLDGNARPVAEGEAGHGWSLHYIARPAS